MTFKIIIAGSRDFTDYALLKRKLDALLTNKDDVTIVSGTARGANQLGEKYATERGYNVMRFPADWGAHGKAAGPIRNAQMADSADALIAFWDGNSRGTKSMITLAEKRGLVVRVVATGGAV